MLDIGPNSHKIRFVYYYDHVILEALFRYFCFYSFYFLGIYSVSYFNISGSMITV
jgi:hypothetical protein